MLLTPSELRTVISVGGNLILDARRYTPSEMRTFVSLAKANNTQITVRNPHKYTASEIRSIASTGANGTVTFDYADFITT
ncbi:hypothetical protein [Sulfurovum mangrovi]|uniref:hypothetical protein n=1 Tax=Sulfurovum mangrovi TaxID=2893889 RepID=UPI001E437785|nr:hypothetical protein [Sulfurovum mangrovi]UFH60472.1 hypothetical protein LN246_06340 [Sulfurovum mangrovi]